MTRDDHRLLALGGAGVAVLIAGWALARIHLAEWRPQEVAERATFEARLGERLQSLGAQLESARPISYLVTDVGGGDEAWNRGRRGPRLLVWLAQPAGWRGVSSRLEVGFAPDGRPWYLSCFPTRFWSILDAAPAAGERTTPEALAQFFLEPGERLGEPTAKMIGSTEMLLFPIRDREPPEHLRVPASPPPYFVAKRTPGTAPEEALASSRVDRMWWRLALGTARFLAVLALFLTLLARRRIDFKDGLLLAGLSLVLSWVGNVTPILSGMGWWWTILASLSAAVVLFLLWSGAESWIRMTDPGFTTGLDLLRAGRLGPRAGRDLLAGAALGAALAGLRLLLHVAAVRIPSLFEHASSVPLPLFRVPDHPFHMGPMVAGYVLFAATLAHWVARTRGWQRLASALIAALLLLPECPVGPAPFGFAASAAVAALLLAALHRFGLAAMLVASSVSLLLPAALLSAAHFAWLSGTFLVAGAVALGVIALGFVSLSRAPEVETEAAVPAFVRRVEEKRRLEVEMELLARMQLGMLPNSPPAVPGYELAAKTVIAFEAGGDFYDFLDDEKGRLWLAIGDVAGHGYSCTIELALVKAALHSLVTAELAPSEVLRQVDRVLRSSRDIRSFTTLTLLRLDPETGEGLISNAAHPYPLLFAAEKVSEVTVGGLPLGQGPKRCYEDRPVHLSPGHLLLFSSDGLFEASDEAGELYGFDRVRHVLPAVAARGADEILAAVLSDWRRHLGEQPATDDTTLVVLKRRS